MRDQQEQNGVADVHPSQVRVQRSQGTRNFLSQSAGQWTWTLILMSPLLPFVLVSDFCSCRWSTQNHNCGNNEAIWPCYNGCLVIDVSHKEVLYFQSVQCFSDSGCFPLTLFAL